MDAETVEAFKQIITRISNNVIDEMAKDGEELNSITYMAKLAEKFERYVALFS